ncbi:MAG: ABC transporter ATP-binding protein [Phycisphaeraceae bacterium]|nr:ABC transporter ATP-binding protein [Phycisphaeraceae bacterium]
MSFGRRSSRNRFRDYLRNRRTSTKTVEDGGTPTKACKRQRSFFELVGALVGLLRGRRAVLGAALVTLTLSTLLGLAMPASTKVALDYILLDTPGPEGLPAWLAVSRDRMTLLWILSGAMLGLAVASIAIGMWGRWHATKTSKILQLRIRRMAFAHAVRLPLHRIHQIKSGGVASILRDDAGSAGDLVFSLIYNPWKAMIQLAGTLIILAVVDWRLLLGSLLLIPTVWMTHRTWIGRLRPLWRDVRQTRQVVDAQATETFSGMRIVRGFSREAGEAARFTVGNGLFVRQQILNWWWSRGIEIVWQLLVPVASGAVLLYGGWQVTRGALTVGDLMMFTAYLLMMLGPIETLVVSAAGVQDQLAGFDRVLDLLDEPREFESVGRSGVVLDRAAVRGEVRFEGVQFRYPTGESPVLSEIDLVAPAGTTVALVGPSGSGKTTLCNLVARFYDPTMGRVLLDGRDLREIDVRSYRAILGIVEQDVFLFDGTVRENIAYAARGVDLPRIQAAARAANADGFIEALEHGYDTIIGERGVRLSGGQRQRIAIARAVLADPRILILDEATSNLDSESEALIQRGLRSLMRDRTCFVIAHRLSTVRHADLIVVLEHGRIIEQGTHEELLERSGRYADFLRMQIEGDHSPRAASSLGI